MCGIFCMISASKELTNSETSLLKEFKEFEELILRRGPNFSKTEFCSLHGYNILLASSVLWLQGDKMTLQPLKDESSILTYNGDIFGGSVIDEELKRSTGDTKLFFEAIRNSEDILQVLGSIQGPFAFIYLDIKNKELYFGRDIYGRRSLLLGKVDDQLIITSVAKRDSKFKFLELPCNGVFSLNLETRQYKIFPWRRKNKNFAEKMHELEEFMQQIFFIDSVELNEPKSFIPPTKTHLKILNELQNTSENKIFDYFCKVHFDKLEKLENLLTNSVKKRILTQPKFCQNCFNQYNCDHAITGLLFSGGVDCAILALLANNFVEEMRPIDLINVAFEKNSAYNTPDRETGLSTLQELQNLCPQRKWNLVEVNVTKEELNRCRSEHISDLIYPLKSILDDSLGCALWFASRAVTSTYTSPCRARMGADELFGGYTRHRAAYRRSSWQGVHEVLEEDWQNLPHRNLARDDRVVSDHGRQLRTPYLDEEVVEFVQSLNCWDRTFPSQSLPQGVGEKILLRCLAYRLGLKKAATFKKRALQFGSRIANSKEKGHEISERLQVSR